MSDHFVNQLLVVSQVVAILFFFAANSFYGVQVVMALTTVREHLRATLEGDPNRLARSHAVPRISLLAPAFNEESSIAESVRSLLSLHYPDLQVIVVNDGSSDKTIEVLKEVYQLEPSRRLYEHYIATKAVRGVYRSRVYPGLMVVDKENGGKADALNVGLNLSEGELVCAIDADTVIEPDALLRLVRPFVQQEDVVAAGGNIRIANGSIVRDGRVVTPRVPRRALPGFQMVEYTRAFLVGRMGLNRMGGNVVISGAFGLFRRDAMRATGGYSTATIGEDMELVMRLRRHGVDNGGPHKAQFIPDPVAWTEVPETFGSLGRQRDRWQRGLAQSLFLHKGVLFRPRYKAMGSVVVPYFVFVELLAPLVEFLGLLALLVSALLGVLDPRFAVLFFFFAYGYGLLLTSMAVTLDELTFRRYPSVKDKAWLMLWVFLEQFGYRQITVYWRLKGLVRFLLGRTDWGAMERKGFEKAPEPVKV